MLSSVSSGKKVKVIHTAAVVTMLSWWQRVFLFARTQRGQGQMLLDVLES